METRTTKLNKISIAFFQLALIIAIIFALANKANAQTLSVFGGPSLTVNLNSEAGMNAFGLEAGALINQSIIVGVYGNAGETLIMDASAESDLQADAKMKCTSKGLVVGYRPRTENLFQLGFSSKIGLTSIEMTEFASNGFNKAAVIEEAYSFAPQVEAMMKLTDWARLNLGVGYQVTSGQSNFANQANSPTANVSIFLDFF